MQKDTKVSLNINLRWLSPVMKGRFEDANEKSLRKNLRQVRNVRIIIGRGSNRKKEGYKE